MPFTALAYASKPDQEARTAPDEARWPCGHCGALFHPTRHWQRWCSNACRQQAYFLRRVAKAAAELVGK
jgi:hypothetical protein